MKIVKAFMSGLIIGMLAVFLLAQFTSSETQTNTEKTSRLWMEYTEDIVRETKPTPPASARLYAYVATAYSDSLDASNSSIEASYVVSEVLNKLHPEYRERTARVLKKANGIVEEEISDGSSMVLSSLIERTENDGFANEWNGERPTDQEYWVGENPLSPEAVTWKRWALTEEDDFEIAPPPAWNSEELQTATEAVKQAALARTPEQAAAINFWGGTPGTEAPAGIWQNRLFAETAGYNLSDREYAYAQKILAQALADSFIECWKSKFTFWTKRPSMIDATIDLAMNNPPFPSYVSGHSTISRTAAEVLSALFPEKRDIWIADATEARNSRLWGGIHFEHDNAEGFKLGEQIGRTIIERLDVLSLR